MGKDFKRIRWYRHDANLSITTILILPEYQKRYSGSLFKSSNVCIKFYFKIYDIKIARGKQHTSKINESIYRDFFSGLLASPTKHKIIEPKSNGFINKGTHVRKIENESLLKQQKNIRIYDGKENIRGI